MQAGTQAAVKKKTKGKMTKVGEMRVPAVCMCTYAAPWAYMAEVCRWSAARITPTKPASFFFARAPGSYTPHEGEEKGRGG